jgi:hypothetical protein
VTLRPFVGSAFMMIRRTSGRLAIALALGTGCTSEVVDPTSERPNSVSVVGDYVLSSVGADLLPIDEGPLPTRDGSPSSCNLIWDVGAISLTTVGFELSYERHSSCGGPPLSQTYEAGTYIRVGRDSLVLTSGYGAEHSARAYGDSLHVRFFEYDLRFRRQ